MNDNNQKKADALKKHSERCTHHHLDDKELQAYIDQLRAHHEKSITGLYKYLKKMDVCDDSIASIMLTNGLEIATSAILNASRNTNTDLMTTMNVMQEAINRDVTFHYDNFKTEMH